MEKEQITCRSCGNSQLDLIISLGYTPLADGLLSKQQLDLPEYTAPLDLAFCADCSLVQITETVPPEILFGRDYPYFSSVSSSFVFDSYSDSTVISLQFRRYRSFVILPEF